MFLSSGNQYFAPIRSSQVSISVHFLGWHEPFRANFLLRAKNSESHRNYLWRSCQFCCHCHFDRERNQKDLSPLWGFEMTLHKANSTKIFCRKSSYKKNSSGELFYENKNPSLNNFINYIRTKGFPDIPGQTVLCVPIISPLGGNRKGGYSGELSYEIRPHFFIEHSTFIIGN